MPGRVCRYPYLTTGHHTVVPLSHSGSPLSFAIITIPSDSEEEEHYEMVQAYHAVPVSVEYEDADNGRPTDHEGSALLGSRASGAGIAKSEVPKEGHATLTSSVGNLANTIIGSGAFAHPLPLFHRRILQLTVYGYGLKACSPFLGYVPLVSLSAFCW